MIYSLEEQYRSMIRALDTLSALAKSQGTELTVANQAPIDAARSFFIQCYHFKDYLKRDPRIPSKAVEKYITASKPLAMVADLCNTAKHAGLFPRPATQSGPKQKSGGPRYQRDITHVTMAYTFLLRPGKSGSIAGDPQYPTENFRDGDTIKIGTFTGGDPKRNAIATAEVMVDFQGQRVEALTLANDCVVLWDSFLAQQGLSFAKR